MKLLTRQEYNLILRSLDYYDTFMTKRDKEIRENLEDKLYYNLYNPKDGVAQTNVKNCSQIAEGYAARTINN